MSDVFATALWQMVEEQEAAAKQKLGRLNELAGPDYDKARRLVEYGQSMTSAGDEALAPHYAELRARLNEREARFQRALNGDPGPHPTGGVRRLMVDAAGQGALTRPPSLYDQDADLESPADVDTIRLAAAPEPPSPGRGKASDDGPEVRT